MRKQTKIAALVSAAALLAIGASMTSFAAGWTFDNSIGHWVYEDSDGYRATNEWKKWQNPVNASDPGNGKWCYLGDDGVALRDQLVPYGEYYYFVDEDGYRVLNEWRYVDNENGEEVNNVVTAGFWYYFASTTGRAYTSANGVQTIDGQKIRFDDYGRVVAGWYTEDNTTWYYYNDQVDEKDHTYGAAANGWVKMAPNPENAPSATDEEQDASEVDYYFDGGKMITGSKYLNKTWYYLDTVTGILKTSGWTEVNDSNAGKNVGVASGAIIYADADGHKKTGWQYISEYGMDGSTKSDKSWFYLDKKGVRFTPGYNKDITPGAAKKVGEDDSKAKEVGLAKINNKYYLFDEEGRMLSGLYQITKVVTCELGSTLKLPVEAIYYFDDADNSQGGKNGWMVTNTRQPIGDGFDNYTNYYFNAQGQAYTCAVVSGAYYGADGTRVDAYDDYEVVDLSVDGTDIVVDGKTLKNAATVYSGNKKSYITGAILVNTSGTVQKNKPVNNVHGYSKYYIGKVPTDKEIKAATDAGLKVYWDINDLDVVKVTGTTVKDNKTGSDALAALKKAGYATDYTIVAHIE